MSWTQSRNCPAVELRRTVNKGSDGKREPPEVCDKPMSRSDRRTNQTHKLRRLSIQLSLASETRQDQHGKTLNLPGQPKATRRHNRHNRPERNARWARQTEISKLAVNNEGRATLTAAYGLTRLGAYTKLYHLLGRRADLW